MDASFHQRFPSIRRPRVDQIDWPDAFAPHFGECLRVVLFSPKDFWNGKIVFAEEAPEAGSCE